MHDLCRFVAYLVAAALFGGCAAPWPQNLPPTRYTGVITNAAHNGSPEPAANISAVRPALRGLGMFTDEVLASAVSDQQGCFVLETRSGYATTLNAVSSDDRLSASQNVGRSSVNNIVLPLKASFQYVAYQGDVDPNSPRAKQADAAMHRIATYISAHPHDRLQSLRAYTNLGVISSDELACFTAEPDWFFGRSPQVEYGWGKQAIIFPSVDRPIAFDQPSFPFGPRNHPNTHGKAR